MPPPWLRWLDRWQSAGLLDAETAQRIRDYEHSAGEEAAPSSSMRSRLLVWLALALGGLLLGAGVLLFVSAHWDDLSPTARMSLIVLAVAAFHGGGVWASERFGGLATTLHAVGTIACGGGIAMAGQIFHIEEHWPSGILLWAVAAWAGVWLLRDWPQVGLAALLTPAWIVSEWQVRGLFVDEEMVGFLLLLAFTYLSAQRGRYGSMWRICLARIGTYAALPLALLLPLARNVREWHSPAVVAAALLPPLVLAYAFRRQAAWMNAIAAVWVGGYVSFAHARGTLAVIIWGALGATLMVAWGVKEGCVERVNLGVAGFACAVLAFYFSSLMDALGRSVSLMVLGVLFLAGGWLLEKLRRHLTAQARRAEP
ncbi:MAG: DUF2157 domain-containing protein [Bryobacterales bacterium]|nr:DUF2157 domain-containing protein [Bryobacterales bacterium]